MGKLTIHTEDGARTVGFDGSPLVSEVLEQAGILFPHPCGGRGVCGKCAVRLAGAVAEPTTAERKTGLRLACQSRLLGDTEVWLTLAERTMTQIETDGEEIAVPLLPMAGKLGAAADIGTTTLALKLFSLADGKCLATVAGQNPQVSVAADVMGRIGAALDGQGLLLQTQIQKALRELLGSACREAGADAQDVRSLVLTCNTTMLYLLTGRNPESLSHAPFEADTLFGVTANVLGREAYLPPCMNAFVGADTTCAVLACGICEQPETALLCDIGTNGEIALWKEGKLCVTSTAAGPAFEGAGISCGVNAVRGAVDRVWVEGGEIRAHTVGEAEPCGVCGSGLMDAVAAYLETELIDETGYTEKDELPLCGQITLAPKDIRQVQLAKAAICAGVRTLLHVTKTDEADVKKVYLAGGFGKHLRAESCAKIGLLPPALARKCEAVGNAALAGAVRLLLNTEEQARAAAIARSSEHVNLGGNPVFNQEYIEQMLFPSQEE